MSPARSITTRAKRRPVARPRLVLVAAFVAATSVSAVVASYGSASSPKGVPGYWLASSSGAVNAYG
ncbi:MAG TPA: hypothetical protein VEJ84_14715, partial [Acidimicrobiales bacterium]|nr:hypothetical protein [Acidimicrobiales bacterium]